jgi:hypothetical protein
VGNADHDVGRHDDGEGFLPNLQSQRFDRLLAGRSGGDDAADMEANMIRRCALLRFDKLGAEAVAR